MRYMPVWRAKVSFTGTGAARGEGDPVAQGGGIEEVEGLAQCGHVRHQQPPSTDEGGRGLEWTILAGGVVPGDVARGFGTLMTREFGCLGAGVVRVAQLPARPVRLDDEFADTPPAALQPVDEGVGQRRGRGAVR
jgi:hypothetical protein